MTFNRFITHLASPVWLFYTLPWLMALIVVTTVTQPSLGLYKAVAAFMDVWIVWAGPLPLPGGLTTLSVLSLNLLARFLFKSEWRWPKAGIHLTHLGVLVLLVGGLVTKLTAQEGYMVIPEGRTSDQIYAFEQGEIRIVPPQKPGDAMSWGHPLATLPFTLSLTDFVRQDYPGTDTPQSYHADVTLTENGQSFPTRIDMNAPLRLQGYTIYQSSFLDVGDRQATILQTVKNQGRLLPYIAGLMMTVGLLLHIVLMKRRVS